MSQTFYEVLGVAPDATTEDIEAAYRERLKETHPDHSDASDAGERTRRVVQARDVLTDPDERERYDRVGHAAYVGEAGTETTADDDRSDVADDADLSAAARAARDAGWGAGDTWTAGTRETGGPDRAQRRRRRERRAADRVGDETGPTGGDDGTGRDPGADPGAEPSSDPTPGADDETGDRSTRHPDGPDTDEAKSGASATHRPHPSRGRRRGTDGGRRAAGDAAANVSGAAPSWVDESGYTVRQQYDDEFSPRNLIPSRQAALLVVLSVLLYPLLLFSALLPGFPIVVNLTVAVCLVVLVAYLQSMPRVAVATFGVLSVFSVLLVAGTGLAVTGIVGLVVLAATWLPLGLSVLTMQALRA